MKNQSGFGALQGLLIVLVAVIIGGTGYNVWNANKNANDSLDKANKAEVATKITSKDSKSEVSSNATTAANFRDFVSDAERQGMKLYPEQKITNLTKLSEGVEVPSTAEQGIKDWVLDFAKKNPEEVKSWGLTINYISKNGQFASGGTNGYLILKRESSAKWVFIDDAGGQSATRCSVVESNKIPADILGWCYKDGTKQASYKDYSVNLIQ